MVNWKLGQQKRSRLKHRLIKNTEKICLEHELCSSDLTFFKGLKYSTVQRMIYDKMELTRNQEQRDSPEIT